MSSDKAAKKPKAGNQKPFGVFAKYQQKLRSNHIPVYCAAQKRLSS